MSESVTSRTEGIRATGRYILIGLLTIAPLGITWLILQFLFTQLSAFGRPTANQVASNISPYAPRIATWLQNEQVLSVLAAILVLLVLWALGWLTTRVIGRRLIGFVEGLVVRIPVVDKIYTATKKFIGVAGPGTGGERRVVLIDFPSRHMKTIGLVTRTLRDKATGEELAAVYVPTSPNPTSGYIEILPLRDVTFTDWTFDQAMSFIVTGGTNAPETISYSESATTRPGANIVAAEGKPAKS